MLAHLATLVAAGPRALVTAQPGSAAGVLGRGLTAAEPPAVADGDAAAPELAPELALSRPRARA